MSTPNQRNAVFGSESSSFYTDYMGIFSVKAYGSVGDGATDDTVTIQDTIDAAETNGGGVVFFPKGNYLFSADLVIGADNIILCGVGKSSYLFCNTPSNKKISLSSRSYCKIRDLSIQGWISLSSCIECEVDNNYVNMPIVGALSGIFLNGCTRCNVKYNTIDSSYIGIQLGNATDTITNKYCNVIYNKILSSGYHAILTRPGTTDGGMGWNNITDNYVHGGQTVVSDYVGIEDWIGGDKVEYNNIIAPNTTNTYIGITLGANPMIEANDNYVQDFGTYGIEAGAIIEGIKICRNTVKGCNIGIVISTSGAPTDSIINDNNIIMTSNYAASYPQGMNLSSANIAQCCGNTIKYKTTLPYTNSASTPTAYVGITGNTTVKITTCTGNSFSNLYYGFGLGATTHNIIVVGCTFDNVKFPITPGGGVPVYSFDACNFYNCGQMINNYKVSVTNSEFYNESDYLHIDKPFAATLDTSNTATVINKNNRFYNVLNTVFSADVNYFTGGSYTRPKIEYLTDEIKIIGLPSPQYAENVFNLALETIPYNVIIRNYLDTTLFGYKTSEGWVMFRRDTGTPAVGTWNIGDKVNNLTPTSGGYIGSVCTVAGTNGTLNGGATTGGITINTPTLVVNSTTGLAIGDYITIAGVAGIKKVSNIVGTTVTIDSNANATVVAAAVAFSTATFKTYGLIS